jgi:hypothetical protein
LAHNLQKGKDREDVDLIPRALEGPRFSLVRGTLSLVCDLIPRALRGACEQASAPLKPDRLVREKREKEKLNFIDDQEVTEGR